MNKTSTKTGYFANGQLRYIDNYLNSAYHGLSKGYHSNGKLSYRFNYINGELYGLNESYYLVYGELDYKHFHLV